MYIKILIAFKRLRLVSVLLIGRSANKQLCHCFTVGKNKLILQFSVEHGEQILLYWQKACVGLSSVMEHWI